MTTPVRAVLMALQIERSDNGFHRVLYKVDGGRAGTLDVNVLISRDAQRKVTTQLNRGGTRRIDTERLVKTWARWAIAHRLDEGDQLPKTITITASDVDEYGAYAASLGDFLR